IHRNWEDWLAILVGVAIGFSPWLVGQQDNPAVNWNAVIIGALVIVLAGLELTGLERWEEVAEIAWGLWLVVSPFIYGYAGALRASVIDNGVPHGQAHALPRRAVALIDRALDARRARRAL